MNGGGRNGADGGRGADFAAAVNWLDENCQSLEYGLVGIALKKHAGRVVDIEKTLITKETARQRGGGA